MELKELVGYLPYGISIEVTTFESKYITKSWGLKCQSDYLVSVYERGIRKGLMLSQIKPILRPMSDLFKFIDYNDGQGKRKLGYFYDIVMNDNNEYCEEYEAEYSSNPKSLIPITYSNDWLYEYHFDIHNLIEKGEAIDINTM